VSHHYTQTYTYAVPAFEPEKKKTRGGVEDLKRKSVAEEIYKPSSCAGRGGEAMSARGKLNPERPK
jgi:hypothetical protein